MKKHLSLYFGWEEFEKFLETKVFKKKIELHQVDFYYWEVVDGEDSISDNELLPKLSKALGQDVSSTHVDEYGVWVIIQKGNCLNGIC